MSDVAVWHWTADAFELAAEAGTFGHPAHVELIEGEVYEMAAMLPPHVFTVMRLTRELGRALDGPSWAVRSQVPIRIDNRSEPEPDMAVALGPDDRYSRRHPGPADLLVVVEVSDTTARFDRTVKLPLYARAGIAEAWIVSLADRTVSIFTRPEGGQFRQVEQVDEDGIVRLAGVALPVREFLPPAGGDASA